MTQIEPVTKPPPLYDQIDPATGLPVTFNMSAVMDWLQWTPVEVYVWMNTMARMYREFGAPAAAQKLTANAEYIVNPNNYK